MKKFLGVLIAVTMCICMFVPAAFAANDSLSSLLEGVDLGSLTDNELSSILGGLNLEGVDLDSLKEAFNTGDSSTLSGLEDAIKNLGSNDPTTPSTSNPLDSLSSMFGDMDMSWLTDIFSDPSGIEGIIGMFTGSKDGSSGDSSSSFDISSIMDMISGAFGGSGLDLGALTGGMDLGSFDISSVLGGGSNGSTGDPASGATNVVASIMDGLKGGLEKLGLDTSMIEGILDNDIVNFFANLYIGLGGVKDPDPKPTEPQTTKPSTTKKPETPKTGDTSTVFVAIGTISVAAAAAFVCLKKKKA